MILVVSDTSPVRGLANLGRLELLQTLFAEVIVPPAVAKELANPRTGQTVVDLPQSPFIRIQAVSDETAVEQFLVDLDVGESEALALALELNADLVLIDETAGRNAARRAGLTVIGLLGILLDAEQRGLLDRIAPLLDQLQGDFRFFIAPQVRSELLGAAGELP